MKSYLLFFMVFIAACKEPVTIPKPVETKWIDAATSSDTVITNVDNNPGILYYASKNWQSSSDTNTTHGYRFLAGSQGDTVVVYKLNDPVNSQEFICGNSTNANILKSQNFLDTIKPNPVRIYNRLK